MTLLCYFYFIVVNIDTISYCIKHCATLDIRQLQLPLGESISNSCNNWKVISILCTFVPSGIYGV